jgi:ubiquinone/menaquinone biosynthesis C-methylase UbiE
MTMRHRGEGTALWYRAFRYRWLERQIASHPDVTRILDLGCGSGENMWRFLELGRAPVGLDLTNERLRRAQRYGPVVQASASALPFADGSLDLVYATHVLHHVAAHRRLLCDVRRCLRQGGTLLLVETVEDHPVLRLGRALHPVWRGDAVESRLRYRQLVKEVRAAGFDLIEAGQYSVLFWLWEILPERWPVLDRLTPLFTALEVLLHPLAQRWAAHCYCLAVPS